MDINEKCREIADGFADVAESIENLSVQDYLLIRQAAIEELKLEDKKPSTPRPKQVRAQSKPIEKAPVKIFREERIEPPKTVAAVTPMPRVEEPKIAAQEEDDDEYSLLRSIPDTWN